MADYSTKQQQSLFSDEERARIGMPSRETIGELSSATDINYQPPGLGTDANKKIRSREEAKKSWEDAMWLVNGTVSAAES